MAGSTDPLILPFSLTGSRFDRKSLMYLMNKIKNYKKGKPSLSTVKTSSSPYITPQSGATITQFHCFLDENTLHISADITGSFSTGAVVLVIKDTNALPTSTLYFGGAVGYNSSNNAVKTRIKVGSNGNVAIECTSTVTEVTFQLALPYNTNA